MAGAAVTLSLTRPPYENGAANPLVYGHPFIEQILSMTQNPMQNDACIFPHHTGAAELTVGDFIHDYILHLARPEPNKFARFMECGTREDNLCGLSHGARNVEGDKGYSQILWFRIDPATRRIAPDSFTCMGL